MPEINEKVEKILINTGTNSLIFEPSEAPTPSGGEKSVRFFDYDGTLIASYTAEEFASLATMPENPMHELLIAQGWNYSLADAQAYVAKYGALDIGQMYRTTDGATKIFCTFGEGRLDPTLYLGINGTVTVDWGDNSTPDTMTGTSTTTAVSQQHIYAAEGDYVISISPEEGTEIRFVANSSQSGIFRSANANRSLTYLSCIKKAYIGTGITSIGASAFYHCTSLQSITIPDSVTSIGGNAFQNCRSLQSITIPDSVTSIGASAFNSCYALQSITIPDGVTSIGASAFYSCYSLQSIVIPDGVTSIGASAFYSCTSLQSITIPDSVTSIGDNTFNSCYALQSITVPDSVTSIGDNTFNSCRSLQSIVIPDGVTSIGASAFYNCYSLQSIVIPDGVTSIGASAFYSCTSLQSITIPDGVTSIGASAFYHCYGLGAIKFESTTPPTTSSSNTWASLSPDCKIYVPTGTLETYTTAANYPPSATYTYVEYDPAA